MSRVGKYPIKIPSGVQVSLNDRTVKAKGKLGELSFTVDEHVNVKIENNLISFAPVNDSKIARTMWGTARASVNNLIKGVSDGFTKKLEINGVGFKAAVQGKILKMSLGFSHEVNFPIPDGIKMACPTPTTLEISGADKRLVGQVAYNIKEYRKPEPYKGKGIKYEGEKIRRKEGKKK